MCRNRKNPEKERSLSFFTERESAVSPVIGVMLMLVVTIIVAAVVSSFAGGLADTADQAPTTSFDISIRAGDGVGSGASNRPGPAPAVVALTVDAGDTLNSGDLQIITTYTVPETYNGVATANAGKVIKHTLDGALGSTNTWSSSASPFVPQVNGYPVVETGLAPGQGMMGGGAPLFGSCQFKPGEQYWFKNRDAFLGFDVDNRMAYGFQEGSVVHVTIVHVPSGQTVFDKDVVAAW